MKTIENHVRAFLTLNILAIDCRMNLESPDSISRDISCQTTYLFTFWLLQKQLVALFRAFLIIILRDLCTMFERKG